MEIIEDRHGKRSTIITSQLPVLQWHEIIGENTIADYPHFFIMRSN
jgi:DNA replication protein DnaC